MKERIIEDIKVIFKNDPSVKLSIGEIIEQITMSPGLHAIWFYRISHKLNLLKIPIVPKVLSQTARIFTGIEIHPSAKIKGSVLIDHGHGVVIGQTAEVGDNVVIYSGVVLGSRNGRVDNGYGAKRHPTIGDNVMIGAGAKILGDIKIGNNVKIGANAVVLKDIPDNSTAVGIPARITKKKLSQIVF